MFKRITFPPGGEAAVMPKTPELLMGLLNSTEPPAAALSATFLFSVIEPEKVRFAVLS